MLIRLCKWYLKRHGYVIIDATQAYYFNREVAALRRHVFPMTTFDEPFLE